MIECKSSFIHNLNYSIYYWWRKLSYYTRMFIHMQNLFSSSSFPIILYVNKNNLYINLPIYCAVNVYYSDSKKKIIIVIVQIPKTIVNNIILPVSLMALACGISAVIFLRWYVLQLAHVTVQMRSITREQFSPTFRDNIYRPRSARWGKISLFLRLPSFCTSRRNKSSSSANVTNEVSLLLWWRFRHLLPRASGVVLILS